MHFSSPDFWLYMTVNYMLQQKQIKIPMEETNSLLLTCWTSAAVLRNSSMYLLPRICLCFFREFWAYSSQANSTKASPVGRPSGYLTNSKPSVPSVTGLSGPRKPSTSCCVAVKGRPRMRIITWFSLERNCATSLDVPKETRVKGSKDHQWTHATDLKKPHISPFVINVPKLWNIIRRLGKCKHWHWQE